jgi:plastocyanin
MNTRARRLASAVFASLLLAGALAAQQPSDSADRADSIRDDSLWHVRLRRMRGIVADTAKQPRPDTAARAGASSGTPKPSHTDDPTAPGPNQVVIYQFVFTPRVLTVPAGTTVTWVDRDVAAHTVTRNGGDDQFESGNMTMGRVFTHTFETPGKYAYICFYHPGMKATVIVTPASPPHAP